MIVPQVRTRIAQVAGFRLLQSRLRRAQLIGQRGVSCAQCGELGLGHAKGDFLLGWAGFRLGLGVADW